MGMFDYVDCKAPLPDGKPTPRDLFQTKDFDDPYMERYTITTEGRLVYHECRHEMVPLEERPNYGKPGFMNEDGSPGPLSFLGCMRRVPLGDRDLNYHGVLNFYGGNHSAGEWREFDAKFTDGTLVEIVQVVGA